MNDNNLKAVRFDIYCKTCKHAELARFINPCFVCLMSGINEGTEQPVYWEEKNE